eukprot:gene8487-5955_t
MPFHSVVKYHHFTLFYNFAPKSKYMFYNSFASVYTFYLFFSFFIYLCDTNHSLFLLFLFVCLFPCLGFGKFWGKSSALRTDKKSETITAAQVESAGNAPVAI